MTIEEIKNQLEELIKDRESFMVGDYDRIYDRDKEALEFAVKAVSKMESEKLKPCPFCGGKPYNSTSMSSAGLIFKIGCGDCEMFLKEFITGGLGFDEFEKANKKLIIRWNRRTDNG